MRNFEFGPVLDSAEQFRARRQYSSSLLGEVSKVQHRPDQIQAITDRLNNARLSLDSAILLESFSVELSLEDMAKAMMLQGLPAAQALLDDAGATRTVVREICPNGTRKYSLETASALIARANAPERFPKAKNQWCITCTSHQGELQEEVTRAALRTLAMGCVAQYMDNRRQPRNRT